MESSNDDAPEGQYVQIIVMGSILVSSHMILELQVIGMQSNVLHEVGNEK